MDRFFVWALVAETLRLSSRIRRRVSECLETLLPIFLRRRDADVSETAGTADIPDLSSVPYGTNDNFAGKVKALWIAAGN